MDAWGLAMDLPFIQSLPSYKLASFLRELSPSPPRVEWG